MLEVRYASLEAFDTADGMTFTGMVIPYGQVITVRSEGHREYDETFSKGAFKKTLKDRNGKPVPLLQSHDYRSWGIGAATRLEETDEGLVGEWQLSDVQQGRDAAVLIRDRVVSGLSIGFEPLETKVMRAADRGEERDLVDRKAVRLYEISLCQFPAYELAGVTSQRSAGPTLAQLAQTRDQLVDRFGRIRRWP